MIGAIESRELELGDNSISYSAAGAVSLSGNTSTNSSANVYSNAHTKTKTVWTHQEGGSLDLSDSDEAAVLVGNYLGDKSGTGEIKGSTGNDTILGGSKDTINLSEGNDTIILSEDNGGANINLTTESESQSTVSGFNSGFDEDADKIVTGKGFGFSFIGGLLQIAYDKAKLMFSNITRQAKAFIEGEEEDSETETETTTEETAKDTNTYKLVMEVDGEVQKTALIGEEATVSSDTTLSGYSEGTALVAGTGATTLTGSDNDDILYTYSGANKTNSNTLTNGTGKDTIMAFDFGSAETSDYVNAVELTGLSIQGNDLVLDNNNSSLTLKDAKNNIIRGQGYGREWVVEFGDDLTYDELVDVYGDANNNSNKLTLNDSMTDSDVAIYMGHREEGQLIDDRIFQNVKEIDARDFNHNASLAGYDFTDETIRGGSGNNSLWGGSVGDDVLIGGSGHNTFYFGYVTAETR